MALTRAFYEPTSMNIISESNHTCTLGCGPADNFTLNINHINLNTKMNQRKKMLSTLMWLNSAAIHRIHQISMEGIPSVLVFLREVNVMTAEYVRLNKVYLLVSDLNTAFINFRL